MQVPVLDSPRSSFSGLSGSPPTLDPSTLAILDSFLTTKADEEQRFQALAEQASARVAELADDTDADPSSPMMSVDEYRLAFGEDWQLSQFW
jgi:EEF1A lysine methyltransferase 1